MHALGSVVPPGLVKTLGNNLHGIAQHSGLALGFGIVLSVAVALWVSVRGMMGIISALNIVYDETERRSFLALVATATALAVGALLFWIVALLLVVGTPFVLSWLGPHTPMVDLLIRAVRWVLITVTALVSMTVLYRFGPSHKQPRWEWLSVGSMVATLLWLAASVGLSFYVTHFSNFGSVYGSLGILVVLQIWFFLTAFVFLLGAEFNIETERQTEQDISD
ncbi:MAG: YihY/virulence factor BrkB family protein [Gammaproteobacteria bacterium]